MNFIVDHLLDLGLPALVFVGLSVWVIRRAVKAARTERDLEQERFEGAFAEELRAAKAMAAAAQAQPLVAVAGSTRDETGADPLAGADTRGADRGHLALIAKIASKRQPQIQVLWVRSNATHAVWCERRQGPGDTREIIRVARIEGGAVTERWSFG